MLHDSYNNDNNNNNDDDDDNNNNNNNNNDDDADGVVKRKSLYNHTRYTYASANKFVTKKCPTTVHNHMKTHELCDDDYVYDKEMLKTWGERYAPSAVKTGPIDGWVMN